ncbi:tRNA (N6-isopentenyl adenosine(37)-C2)-methylthiotransferase MiaB [Patescibacteria group bacterium]|nr:tRNA (N6-isopentenyl adenosine(37)-C2)-methylthiotransferase MiaB [Patescibacteria group bacterium]MBU1448946.1 tRNA (N6-isopentenyl adenosine(37)-C2)-methylthiotransferase MiaB [Patescibacteria group bacterium]MBU2612892.1 tRNA (N6-isopentenyl adenosine(37)-C2)-methylthiotransferase MiaB [Patescibacteria group bacterium]
MFSDAVPKYRLLVFGCQMNKNDAERISRLLSDMGLASTEDETEADVIVMVTCSVRQSAEERIYGKMEDLIDLKKRNPRLLVGVTGCMAGRDRDGAIRKRLAAVDFFFPTAEMGKLSGWIAERWGLPTPVGTPDSSGQAYLDVEPLRPPSIASAFVTIQTGCDKYCAYCVVPYARGRETNRPVAAILDEVRSCVDRGIVEVVLLGQSVNSYRAPDAETFSKNNPYADSFAALLWETDSLPGIRRVHWTAAHPVSMSDEVIDALGLSHQVNYLHLPVQSGSDEVLRRMNRKYTRQGFLDIIEAVKHRRPGIALGTDFIVGFPGETDAQFEETLSLYVEADFDIAYPAEYSQRTGTLAARLYPDDIPADVKRGRRLAVQDLMERTTLRKNRATVGTTVEVLVASVDGGEAVGTSSEQKVCRFPCDDPSYIGRIVPIRINTAQTWQCHGNMLRSS